VCDTLDLLRAEDDTAFRYEKCGPCKLWRMTPQPDEAAEFLDDGRHVSSADSLDVPPRLDLHCMVHERGER
jgi:hypothetical protein